MPVLLQKLEIVFSSRVRKELKGQWAQNGRDKTTKQLVSTMAHPRMAQDNVSINFFLELENLSEKS